MVVSGTGHQHAARLAELLEARRDVNAIAQQVLALDHHVAEIDAHAEHDAPLRRRFGLPCGGVFLDRDRAGNGVDHRAELGDGAVAHELDDAAVMPGQQGIDHLAAQILDRLEGGRLVLLDQSGISNDIGGENCRQPSFNSRSGHRKRLHRSRRQDPMRDGGSQPGVVARSLPEA